MDEDRKTRICLEVLKQGYRRIYFELRFLEQALFHLIPEESKETFFGSDGENLYYGKEYLLTRYLQSPEAVSCDYLHTVIHCLYQHPFQASRWEERYWNLASDIAVADVLREMDVIWISQQIPEECLEIADRIRKEVPVLSAAHIAGYLRNKFAQKESLYGYCLGDLEKLFRRDSHECWKCRREDGGTEAKKDTSGEGDREDAAGKGAGEETKEDASREEADEEESKGNASGEAGPPGHTSGKVQSPRLSEEWKGIAEAVALNAGSFSKGQGKMPGSMLLTIQRLTREQYDYTEFLRKFAILNEQMKVNQEEFDYSYYLYGLRLLGKIPLIEPLEYKEELQIREFVIVIDTSGSCSGDLVERFLNKTYNILSQTECFAQRIVLHIIQCDAAVQEDVKIESPEHMKEYIEGMELRGGGGTDFRPAFAYVEELRRSGELKRLCGMLYFTDGYGTFPEQPPDYKTVFAFVEREDAVRVPPWAMCLYLDI